MVINEKNNVQNDAGICIPPTELSVSEWMYPFLNNCIPDLYKFFKINYVIT